MKLVLTILLAFLDLIVFSQLRTTGVLELTEQADIINSSIYPLGRCGFLIHSKTNEDTKNELTFYSANMEKQVSVPFDMERNFVYHGIFANADSTRFSFLFSSKSGWITRTFYTETRTMTHGEYEKAEPYFIPLTSVSFKEKVVMNGLLHHRRCLLVLDLQTGKQDLIELPGLKSKGTILSMNTDSSNERLSIFYKTSTFSKKGTSNLIFMNADGILSDAFILNPNSDYTIVTGEVTWLGKDAFILAGTYGLSRFSNRAAGFYFSKWEKNVQQLITYHSFSKFHDYLTYLPQDHLKIIEAVKGYRTDFVENRVVVHPAYVSGSGYRLICEVYYPTSTYENTTKVDKTWTISKNEIRVDKKEQTEVNEVFEGYKYTHAAVLDLDEAGNKIHDYCFALKLGMMPQKVTGYVRVNADSAGSMKMSYIQRKNGVFVQEIVDDKVQTTFLDGIAENIDAMGERTHNLQCVYWYDTNYLLYGLHSVRWTPDGLILDSGRTPSIFFVKRMSCP